MKFSLTEINIFSIPFSQNGSNKVLNILISLISLELLFQNKNKVYSIPCCCHFEKKELKKY